MTFQDAGVYDFEKVWDAKLNLLLQLFLTSLTVTIIWEYNICADN